METIRIETVLELVSDEIWRAVNGPQISETGIDMPSLRERMQIVQEVLPYAIFDGRTVSVGEEVSDLHEIPFFNYLLLNFEAVITEFPDGSRTITDYVWNITGFYSFEELDDFVQHQEFLCGFRVYVRHRDYYKQVQYRLAFQRPGEEKTYTNEWGFYCPDADLNDIDSRNPDYNYSFEIVGLCELRCKNDIWCYILGSLDDLTEYLLGRAIDCDIPWVRELGRITGYQYQETGEIHYEGKDYTYCIKVNDKETGWEIYDKDKRPYCVRRHSFCTQESTSCENYHDCNGDSL